MTVSGLIKYISNNIVRNPPNLPIPMFSGTISWSVNFAGFPQATLNYTNIASSDIRRFGGAYNHRAGDREINIKIYGISFVVDSYAYDRTGYTWRGTERIDVYSCTVGLKSAYEFKLSQNVKIFDVVDFGSKQVSFNSLCQSAGIQYTGPNFFLSIDKNSDRNATINLKSTAEEYSLIYGSYVSYNSGIEFKKLTEGKSWSFDELEITTDGANTLNTSIGYKDAILTWQPSEQQSEQNGEGVEFRLQQPDIQTVFESDEDPESPPSTSAVLRTYDSNHDMSGPKKVRRRNVTIDGTTESTQTWTYGFEFLAEDIWIDEIGLFSDKPANFWKVVEYEKTQYIYQRIKDLALTIKAKDPATGNSTLSGFVSLLVHPDYRQFVSGTFDLGDTQVFRQNNLYLVETRTKGWKRFRFQQEDDSRNTLDKEDEFYRLFKFKTLPSESKTAYRLISTRSLYSEASNNLPFSVEWVEYESLEPRIKELVDSSSDVTQSGKIGLLYPDPNYVEPLTILVESSYNSSFAFTPHPDSSLEDPIPPLITGEESYFKTERKILNASRYKETLSEFSTQNSGFSDLAEKKTFKDVLGKPPEATVRKRNWEKQDREQNSNNEDNNVVFYVLNSNDNKYATPGESLSFPNAKTQSEAETAAKTQLALSRINSDQSQRTLFSFYNNIRDGDRVVVPKDEFAGFGKWRVVSCSWQLEFSGISTKYGLRPICKHSGTSLNLGLESTTTISVERRTSPVNNSKKQGDPEVTVTSGKGELIGEILNNNPNRRKF